MNASTPLRPALSLRGLRPAPAVWSGKRPPRSRRRPLAAPRRRGWRSALLMAATLVLVLIVRAGPHPYTEVQALVPASFSPPALPPLVREPSLHPTLSVAPAKRFDPILHGPQVPRMRPAKTRLASRAVARPPLPPVHRSAPAPMSPAVMASRYAPSAPAPASPPVSRTIPRNSFDPFAASSDFDPFR